MIPVEEAQRLVMAEVALGGVETLPLDEALGRVLREEIVASEDSPAADNSAMDGYAVRAADLPGTLRVIGDVAAGHVASLNVESGTAMRIMTGAYVPSGADTVVQVELTDGGLSQVVAQAVPVGANIRRRGSDVRAGSVMLREGVRIDAPAMAMLASARKSVVRVGRRPTVAILSTGDELINVDAPPEFGKIVNTNEHLLTALVREAGAIPRPLGIVHDTRDATIAAFESAIESDFVISSGGVSVGAFDFVKDALEALGAESKFWRVAMKPGKPVVVSRLHDRLIFGLPGNPVSCFVSFHLFVLPALRKWAGQERHLFPSTVRARLLAPIRGAGERRVYVRVHVSSVDGELVAQPLTSQASGALTSMFGANGLAIVPEGVERIDSFADVLLIGAL